MRHVVGALHQRDLGRRLDHAAAGGDRIGADVVERRRFGLDAVHDEEAQPLLDADAAGGDAAVLEDLRDRRGTGSRPPARCGCRSPNLISSRARASSKPGQTHANSPLAGMTATNGRSLWPQRTPVK